MESASDALPEAEPVHEYLAAAYATSGDRSRAALKAKRLLELFPDTNLTYYGYLYDYWREEDLQYHLAGLRAAGVPEWPFGFKGKEGDRVSEADLRKLVDNKTWIGKHKNGTDFIQYFDKSGNTAYRSANTNITGVAEIRDGRLCETFGGFFLDRMVCGYIYRNQQKHDSGARYIHVTPQALKFFSLSPA